MWFSLVDCLHCWILDTLQSSTWHLVNIPWTLSSECWIFFSWRQRKIMPRHWNERPYLENRLFGAPSIYIAFIGKNKNFQKYMEWATYIIKYGSELCLFWERKKNSSIHKYLKTKQKSTLLSGKAWLGVQDGEGAGLNKNMHGSVGPGGFNGGVCVHENGVLILKYFLKRLFIRESNLSLLVLCWKPTPFRKLSWKRR